jgi:cyclic GMP-AMP synthase
VLDHLVELMKQEDVLFSRIYRRICGAGSYYDGLKVGKPEEFDMDIVLRLPIKYEEAVVSHLMVSHPIF